MTDSSARDRAAELIDRAAELIERELIEADDASCSLRSATGHVLGALLDHPGVLRGLLVEAAAKAAAVGLKPGEYPALQPWGAARLPRRDDDVATWLKGQRDRYPQHTRQWTALDEALEDYRLRADTGTPLDERAYDHGERGDRG